MAIYTTLGRDEIATLLAEFPALPKEDFDFKGVAMGTVNTYYRIRYQSGQTYYLKIDEVGDLARLKNELRIFDNLKAEACKLSFIFPYPLFTRKKKAYLPFGKKFILIFPEVAGEIIFEDKLTTAQLKKIGSCVAELHKIRLAPGVKAHRFALPGIRAVFTQIKDRLKAKHPELAPFIERRLALLQKDVPKNEKLVLIHADLFAENIHWKGKKLNGILDYEAAGAGSPLFDVCVCLHALCHDKSQFDLKKIRAFLSGYQTKRPLSKKEKQAFWYYLEQTSMRFLLTRLRDFELAPGDVKAEPFKDYRDFVKRFQENQDLRARFKLS